MDAKLTLLVLGTLGICYQIASVTTSPTFRHHPVLIGDGIESYDTVDTFLLDQDGQPVAIVKREAPVSRRHNPSKKVKGEAKGKDLQTSATGYGYGGGHGYGGSLGPTGYVGYGARTGGYGAFSWYTDHPVGGGYGYH